MENVDNQMEKAKEEPFYKSAGFKVLIFWLVIFTLIIGTKVLFF